MSLEITEIAKAWTQEPFDENTRTEVQSLIDNDPKELYECFYKNIDFGTGGMRGVMGSGTNRINKYTLGQASEGLSRYLKQKFPGEKIRIAIAHDTRNNARSLVEAIQAVFTGHDFEVHSFPTFAPTPLLSYAVRELKCHAGIVLTASHNPPKYNGYKVYWNDGGQIVPPHDKAIIEEVRKVNFSEISFAGKPENIKLIGEDLLTSYFEKINSLKLFEGNRDIKIVFTPLHGTTVSVLPAALEATGFTTPIVIEEQATADGNFPTVASPNPEESEALEMAVQKALDINADLVIGTDPDGDRIGIGVPDENGKMVLLNGNQTAAVLIHYLLNESQNQGKLPSNGFIAKTIVTTDLLSEIAHTYGIESMECLTGFKWIAALIRENEGIKKFIGGGEESYGYLVGDFVRDKDSIVSAVMIAEVVAWAKNRGSSFFRELKDIYLNYGYYHDELYSLTLEGSEGAQRIADMMEDFRKNPPRSLMGEEVELMKDFKFLQQTHLSDQRIESIDFESSNVLQFYTSVGSRITVRPSGTEPKIKFYFSLKENFSSGTPLAQLEANGKAKVKSCLKDLGLD
jgi:phosphoglucomutase